MKQSRTAFLAASTVGAAALVAAAAPAQGAPGFPPIGGILKRPAHHKQVIAAPRIAGGAALRYAGNTLNAFEHAYGEGARSCHTLCVFFGTSLFYVANDTLWARYALFDVLDGAGDALPAMIHTPQNPFLHAHGARADVSIEALSARGVTWIVCNNALTELAHELAAQRHLDPAVVYDDMRANLVAGVTLVPAGVAAIVLAQEAGFTLLPA